MSDVPTDKLTEQLASAQATLAELLGKVEPGIKAALHKLMSTELGSVVEFNRLSNEQPEIAKRIPASSVSALAKLQIVDMLTAELKRRPERN